MWPQFRLHPAVGGDSKNVDKTEEDSKEVNETIFYNNKFDNLKDASAR